MASKEAEKEPQGKGKEKSVQEDKNEDDEEEEVQERFSPEEEASLLAESNASKTAANALFASSKYDDAIAKYDEAVAACPDYLDYELAVLRSNIAACHLKLARWHDAVSSATAALDGLDRIDKEAALERDRREKENAATAAAAAAAAAAAEDDDVEDEIVSAGASKAAPAPLTPEDDDDDDDDDDPAEAARRRRRADDVLRIRAKALMRRARARSEDGGWQSLAGAEEDYRALAAMPNLAPADRRIVQAQLRVLPPRTKAAQDKETAEMWGKLKDLGNGILKPFGLSTENFQMVKDEKTGGYSMNFNQGQ